eukprot:TRINITY_DN720_c0_g1_i2.p2 TRINITY_DN720_c0_g1~~TRINITY_DN720_c0_g1_i2.p2  ORF type:complete len:133 (+),score=5.44 TRINITY_DN720_c0_g1_i2:287-685(+)
MRAHFACALLVLLAGCVGMARGSPHPRRQRRIILPGDTRINEGNSKDMDSGVGGIGYDKKEVTLRTPPARQQAAVATSTRGGKPQGGVPGLTGAPASDLQPLLAVRPQGFEGADVDSSIRLGNVCRCATIRA